MKRHTIVIVFVLLFGFAISGYLDYARAISLKLATSDTLEDRHGFCCGVILHLSIALGHHWPGAAFNLRAKLDDHWGRACVCGEGGGAMAAPSFAVAVCRADRPIEQLLASLR